MFFLLQVDEQMRQELAELKLSVDKDKGGKTKANTKVLRIYPDLRCDLQSHESSDGIHDCFHLLLRRRKAPRAGRKRKRKRI